MNILMHIIDTNLSTHIILFAVSCAENLHCTDPTCPASKELWLDLVVPPNVQGENP